MPFLFLFLFSLLPFFVLLILSLPLFSFVSLYTPLFITHSPAPIPCFTPSTRDNTIPSFLIPLLLHSTSFLTPSLQDVYPPWSFSHLFLLSVPIHLQSHITYSFVSVYACVCVCVCVRSPFSSVYLYITVHLFFTLCTFVHFLLSVCVYIVACTCLTSPPLFSFSFLFFLSSFLPFFPSSLLPSLLATSLVFIHFPV